MTVSNYQSLPARLRRSIVAVQSLALSGVATVAYLTASRGNWDLALMAALLALALASDFAQVEISDSRIAVSGSFIALVLAIILLGGPPAAVIGVLSIALSWPRTREEPHALRQNLTNYALFPLVIGLVFSEVREVTGLGPGDGAYYLLVFLTFVVALGVNFLIAASYAAVLGRAPLRTSIAEALIPLLASEMVTGMLAVGSAYLYNGAGLPGLVLIGVAIVAFQHLLGELLASRNLAEELRRQAVTDELTGLGNRRKLMEDLDEALAAVADDGQERLLIAFDLDGFKDYNDTFGHPEGDLLLARLGSKLADATESAGGTAYRPGGDEFNVLARASLDNRTAVVAAAAGALTEIGPGFRVQASFGSVMIPSEAAGRAEALRLADRRMYERKEGRGGATRRQASDLLLKVLEEQQPDLHEHIGTVGLMARAVGRDLGMGEAELEDVARAAELHDVGKVAIPESILAKPGPLDEQEWSFMRRHTIIGERILQVAPALRNVAALVRASHERWDGKGYPDGLAGEEIPLGARIIAVCDSFEAMTAKRSYKPARSASWSLQELSNCAGSQFDPAVVEAFCRLYAEPGALTAA